SISIINGPNAMVLMFGGSLIIDDCSPMTASASVAYVFAASGALFAQVSPTRWSGFNSAAKRISAAMTIMAAYAAKLMRDATANPNAMPAKMYAHQPRLPSAMSSVNQNASAIGTLPNASTVKKCDS